MTLTHLNTLLAFAISLSGLLIYRSHMMSSLLCLEGMVLSLFMMMTMSTLTSQATLTNMLPIALLVFAAFEAALGLSLLVTVSNTYGTDHVQNLNLLQC
ncbi:NADH dehydrogenase subunit 4L (mitochondrion) [Desmodus rotundus]|uniref:NADH-ubiquinone oxidoreductase chain 4L n=1 Tax=Desmodus rotundus TaxID=9430 RepID=T2KGT5_DESRO|nr:NADH dehydrogenase subunit 4L [Desmodus rotundus]CDF66038.1 ND4L [Desmodus rotundus]